MPRLPNSLLRHARAINSLYPILLQTCRTIPSAHNELRWLREHVDERLEKKFGSAKDVPERLKHRSVAKLARKRGRGEPLQYLLGSQPFGDLDIKCGKGVLIPRQCTEAYTETLAHLIKTDIQSLSQQPSRVRIIDFCTGTGCIPLHLLSFLSKSMPNIQPDISGIDISPTALALATRNYHHNISHFGPSNKVPKRQVYTRLGSPKGYDLHGNHCFSHSVIFEHANLLDSEAEIHEPDVWGPREGDSYGECDNVFTIVTSNPPYISKAGFEKQTERSVRNYEPKLALVPEDDWVGQVDGECRPEDIFYVKIADRAIKLAARIMLLEVAGTEQACRVAKMVIERQARVFEGGLGPSEGGFWEICEIWGDEPDADYGSVEDLTAEERREMAELGVVFKGAGMGRSVYFRRREVPVEKEGGYGCFIDLRSKEANDVVCYCPSSQR